MDGTRVQTITTPAGGSAATTNFLADTSGSLSHVVAETNATGALLVHYVRGDDLLALMRPLIAAPASAADWQTRYYHADHIGSVRRLTSEGGFITDGYTYSAFGELLAHTGSDPQPYAFTGEPYDPNVGFQYHRARWMDPRIGRFQGMDLFGGIELDPRTLHRYSYAHNSPANWLDPTGLYTQAQGYAVEADLCDAYVTDHPGSLGYTDCGSIFPQGGTFGGQVWNYIKPDILDHSRAVWMEVKPLSYGGITSGVAQMGIYGLVLMPFGYSADFQWQPNPARRTIGNDTFVVVNLGGVLFYTDDLDIELELLAMAGAGAYANRAALLSFLRSGVGMVSEIGYIGRLLPPALSGNQSRGLAAVMGAIMIAVTSGLPI